MEVNGRDVSRKTVTIDGTDARMYSDGHKSWPSVSTVLDARPTPEKDKSIQGWKNWLKGQDDRPDPDEVLSYKGARGTLAHYRALDPLTPRDLAGDEEVDAYQSLDGWEYRHEDALTLARKDVGWFEDAFREMAEEEGFATFNDDGTVLDHSVRAVEKYVTHDGDDHHSGYAGQFDLAYDRPDGTTVVSDLKTSKADSVSDLLDKKFPRYGMQLAAYARAVSFEVDDIAVLWASPDTRESAVITGSEMPKCRAEYERAFLGHVEQFHQTTLDGFHNR